MNRFSCSFVQHHGKPTTRIGYDSTITAGVDTSETTGGDCRAVTRICLRRSTSSSAFIDSAALLPPVSSIISVSDWFIAERDALGWGDANSQSTRLHCTVCQVNAEAELCYHCRCRTEDGGGCCSLIVADVDSISAWATVHRMRPVTTRTDRLVISAGNELCLFSRRSNAAVCNSWSTRTASTCWI